MLVRNIVGSNDEKDIGRIYVIEWIVYDLIFKFGGVWMKIGRDEDMQSWIY